MKTRKEKPERKTKALKSKAAVKTGLSKQKKSVRKAVKKVEPTKTVKIKSAKGETAKAKAMQAKPAKSQDIKTKKASSSLIVAPCDGKVMDAATPDKLTKEAKRRLLALDAGCQDSYESYEDRIAHLDGSAKIKRVLRELLKTTKEMGGKVIRLGKIVLDFALNTLNDIKSRFPYTANGILIVIILQVILSGIPLLGMLWGALLTPLFMTVVVAAGLALDIRAVIVPIFLKWAGKLATI